MNQRIKALAEQAGIQMFEDRAFGWSVIAGTDHNVQRFAELIVRECMKVAALQRNPANLNYKPSERFVEDLRQHFGVEE